MPSTYEEEEAKIQSIIDAIPPDFKPNISRLARENDVNYHRLLARYHGRSSLLNRAGGHYKLNDSQNFVLREFVRFLDQLEIGRAHV